MTFLSAKSRVFVGWEVWHFYFIPFSQRFFALAVAECRGVCVARNKYTSVDTKTSRINLEGRAKKTAKA
jgi:hypothetical protein